MNNRILVIQLPEFPFNLDQLLPSVELAELATRLKSSDKKVSILDFANLDSFIELNPDSQRPHAQAWAEQLYAQSPVMLNHLMYSSLPPEFQSQWQQFYRNCLSTISKFDDIEVIVFHVRTESSSSGAAFLSNEIKRSRPSISTCAWGPYYTHHSDLIPDGTQQFDSIITGHSQSSLHEWVSIHSCPHETWQSIPNLAYQDGTRLNLTSSKSIMLEPVQADYTPETYSGIGHNTKINLFTIREQHRKEPGQNLNPEIKSPSDVIQEIRLLQDTFGAQCFHIEGADDSAPHPKFLAYEFLKRKLNIRYTRECHINTTGTAAVTAMNASGCHSLSFDVYTGSQRLLEDLYLCNYTITQVEQSVRTCKFSNINTIINLALPGSEDDYHTEAESLRLIERTRPSSVHFSEPDLPGHKKADSYRKRSENKEARERHFVRTLHDNNVSTGLSPQMNLLLDLVGQKGNETQFLEDTLFQFLSGDVEAVKQLVGAMNDAACLTPNVLHFKPFQAYQHVVGN
jgi:hypothetical protein